MKKEQENETVMTKLSELEKLSQRINRQHDFTDITDEEINQVVDEVRREMYAEQESQNRRKVA